MMRPGSSDFLMVRQINQIVSPPPTIMAASPRRYWPRRSISMFAGHALGIAGAADRSVVTNDRAAIEIVDAGVHQHHAILAAGLNERFEHMLVVLADYIPNRAGGDEQFI